MATYYINIHENNETETAMFTKENAEELWSVVMEVMEGLGFQVYVDEKFQRVNFHQGGLCLWEDTLNQGVGLWGLEYHWDGNQMELYAI